MYNTQGWRHRLHVASYSPAIREKKNPRFSQFNIHTENTASAEVEKFSRF